MTMTDIDKILEEAKAGIMPFESWERLPGETASSYAAFCSYRDYGADRNIRRAVEGHFRNEEMSGSDKAFLDKKYRLWRQWSGKYQWKKRAADYDVYIDHLKQAELRKTIEERGEAHRKVTDKMLQVVSKKLDLMDAAELSQGAVVDWVETAIKAEREILGVAVAKDESGGNGGKQIEINFAPELKGL